MITFVGRESEMKYLKESFGSNTCQTIILYGRRRLGKTTLLKHTLPENSLYYLCTQESSLQNLQQFKSDIAQKLNNPLIQDSQATSWVSFFASIKDLIPNNFIFAFDEFPYLVLKDSSIPSQFQKIIDEYLIPTKAKIVLCGSSLSIMRELQEYQSPLYGRRTKSLQLQPFMIKDSLSYLKPLKKKEAFLYHLIFGGVPYYLNQINTNIPFEENITSLFFAQAGIFIDEPQFLLLSEFKEIQNYLAIIKVIAKGKTTFSQISDSTFIEKGSLSKYLTILQNLQIVGVERSYFSKQNSKTTRYFIQDNFISFYYQITQNKNLYSIIGKLFEREVRKIYAQIYPDIRPYFKNDLEIDMLYKSEGHTYCTEIKLKGDTKKILAVLEKKIQQLPPNSYKSQVITLENDLHKLQQMQK